MAYFIRDNIKFHYLERGSGVPFFFQHGLGGEAERIFALVELPPRFRLLGMDCRGHGKTTPLGEVKKLRFDAFADDLIALMSYLQIPQAVIGGTSMGAGVALNCALRYPQRVLGLVLLRPAWLEIPTVANADLFNLIARMIRDHGPEAGLEIFKHTESYRSLSNESSDVADSLAGLFQDPRAVETVARLERVPQDAPNHDRAEWRKISAPTLVLANRCDPIHPFTFGEVLAREIPDAQFEELTPKSVDLAQYTSDLRRKLADFLQRRWAFRTSSPNALC
jgi:pimeloyl-ACP methyl ester carboxylesterase